MSIKAFKLTVAEIKNLCDTFDVDRSAEGGKSLGKDDLIDRLLDFLGKPEKKSTKTQQKKSSKKKAATSSSSSKEEKVEKGKMPSDKALRKWVQAYVACFNLDKATTKHAMETASEKFGIDLSEKKSRIKELLAEEMWLYFYSTTNRPRGVNSPFLYGINVVTELLRLGCISDNIYSSECIAERRKFIPFSSTRNVVSVVAALCDTAIFY